MLVLVFTSSAWAQVDRAPQAEPDSEFSAVPFSAVIRDEGAPYEDVFRSLRVGPSVEPRFGGGGEGEFTARVFGRPDFASPFARGFRPEDAELKLGPFYLDVRSVSGGLLYSDNINATEFNREDGVIGIMRLHMTALLQLTENLRFAVSGVLIYLPFQNEIGIAGFGADDFFARFDYWPIARAQLSYDFKIGDWEIVVFDEFRMNYIRPIEGVDFEVFDEGQTFDEEDRAGRYVYRPRGDLSRDAGDFRDRRRRGLDEVFVGAVNVVGASANILLPTVTRLTVGADHSNYWYINRPSDARLPSERDHVYGTLISERETLRFKPYTTYEAWTTDLYKGWRQEAHAGVFGPVTENLSLRGDVGYFWGSGARESVLWLLSLRHTPHPRMYHELRYTKRVTQPDEDLKETLAYRLRYSLSRDLSAVLFASRSDYDDVQSSERGALEYKAGIRFTYDLARRTTLRLGTVFTRIENENPAAADVDRWSSRAEILYRYTQTVHARLLYQHLIRDSNLPLDSYEENLVILTLTKYF
ncbi:MAG: outer membrane beta-barrel protein [Verrucomicrobia bacterium]|nr:outer membrane beta-barrel protein [Verrucomicrobiota bacterium]